MSERQAKITELFVSDSNKMETPGSKCSTSLTRSSVSGFKRPVTSPENGETDRKIHLRCNSEDSPGQKDISNRELGKKLDIILSTLEKHDEQLKKLDKLDQIERDLNSITERVSQAENEIQTSKSEIVEIKRSLEFAHGEIKDMKLVQKETKCKHHTDPLIAETQARILAEGLSKIKTHSQKENLIFERVPEEKNEDCVRLISYYIFRHLRLPNAQEVIDVAHRLGPKSSQSDRPRAIIVKFKSRQARDTTFARRKMFKNSKIWVKRASSRKHKQRGKSIKKGFQGSKDKRPKCESNIGSKRSEIGVQGTGI